VSETPPGRRLFVAELVAARTAAGLLQKMSHRPNITIGTVPLSAGAHSGLLGAYAIAESDAVRIGVMETPQEGVIVEHPPAVSRMRHTFDNLQPNRCHEQRPSADPALIIEWTAQL
jgi:Domain of unknown function (DUF5753)